ncbi:Predicted nucleic-acid-binding protein containing a Zn-ribbon [Nocardia otitidiscaviarum]|uniref:Predicted nucleic-acid-binding protein containing a Zn-ribbon n=1 Tax=Nocardia otitidiscaviarum TaxID=1823 RepID=A0A379JKZ8_9NOCA|nr:OB-fold domain-containing protein [Nocardia otitidiscaviarum]SUD49282.1 Predicted nucleic-acid-binding protein containing a Zn-ribbon [Nocardia otitidiscaviarum]
MTDELIDPQLMVSAGGRYRLRGGRCAGCGDHHFPLGATCPRCGGTEIAETVLADEGVLWSWTVQRFPPPSPPYARRPDDFVPFGLGYVELPGQLIVETLLTDSDPARLRIGMPMRLTTLPVLVESGRTATTFAFAPIDEGER